MARRFVRIAGLCALLAPVGTAAWSCAGEPGSDGQLEGYDAGGQASSSSSGAAAGNSSGSPGNGSSSGGSSGGPMSGSSSGTTSGSSGGSGSGSSSGAVSEAGACAVTATGGLALTGTGGNYLQSPAGASPSYAGYAFALSDSTALGCGAAADAKACGTSVGCLATGEFCGSGTTGVKNGGITYGAGIGANLGQSTDGGTSAAVTISGTGLTYAVTSVPPNSLEIEIKNGTTDYCYLTTAASGTVPWGSFVEKCTSSVAGAAFAGTSITGVSFTARAGAAAAPYDFCVTTLTL